MPEVGGAPNVSTGFGQPAEMVGTLVTAKFMDTAPVSSNSLVPRSYTIVSPSTTPTTGQIAIGGVQAGDVIVGTVPQSTYPQSGGQYIAIAFGVVVNANTIVLAWANTTGFTPAPAPTVPLPVGLLLYRPVTQNPKLSFDG